MRKILLFIISVIATGTAFAANPSQVWVSDLGNGTYRNPVLMADYSDPDVCRAGEDYYMTSSSFNCVPGLQILHSRDMVNWTLAGAAIRQLEPSFHFAGMQHGNGVWAPSIRYHGGQFWIYWGDPDFGIYMVKADDPTGEWSQPVMVTAGKGLIDACPLWDDDGQMYLVHAYAGSRAGIKSLLAVTRLTPDGTRAVGMSRTVYDGHASDETIEGPKFYKRDGWYYIFAPAGGVATGWQVALRSKSVWGPYERRIVMAQGQTAINGPHQGAWVDTPGGQDWFFHFQDRGPVGRVVHLQPMAWKDGWPVIGADPKGTGCGEPVATHKKPDVGRAYPIATPADSDEFTSEELGLQWQWHANPMGWWHFCDAERGTLGLYTVPCADGWRNLWDTPNLLLQKNPAEDFTATAKLTFTPNPRITGERAGLVVMGLDYGVLAVSSTPDGLLLSQSECYNADKGTPETGNASVKLDSPTVWLRVKVTPDAMCVFSWSADGHRFAALGKPFKMREGKWIGAKTGIFATRAQVINDGGRADFDFLRFTKK